MDEAESSRLRSMMGRFATGVTVVAARHGPLLAGMTANGIASISIDPPLMMASIGERSETPGDRRQPCAEWHEAETGSPILEGAIAYFDCRLTARHPGGDHTIFVGAIVAAGYREDAAPLLWFGSRYRRISSDEAS